MASIYQPPQPPQTPPPPPPKRRSRLWLWLLLGGGAFFIFIVAVFALLVLASHGNGEKSEFAFGDKIGVIDLEGVIIEPQTIAKQLKKFGEDDSIKAIVLHVNTPGGGVAASEEIYEAVKRVREKNKKRIVASVETVGASGGYYVACATDKIYADRGSIVGSIGVISQWVNYGDFLKWAKLKDVTFKAGALKDTGNPAREMTDAEKKYFQALLDDMHGQFISAVAKGRKMKEEDVKAIADGRVWTGQEAKELKMIDQIGDFDTAVHDTAKAVGIEGEPTIVRPEKQRRTLFDILFGDVSEYIPSSTKLMENHPGFYFLWK
jgi:protease-4